MFIMNSNDSTSISPFRLIVIGGGPSAISLIIRAIRTNFFEELCESPGDVNYNIGGLHVSKPLGVCVISSDSSNNFGSGKLADYEINSNTPANNFSSHILDDRPSVIPPELVTGTCLERVRQCPSALQLESLGSKEVQLSCVGDFLLDLGAAIRCELSNHPACSLHFNTRAIQLQRMHRDSDASSLWCVTTTADEPQLDDRPHIGGTNEDSSDAQLSPGSVCPAASDCSLESSRGAIAAASSPSTHQPRRIYAQNIVLATGGTQKLPRLEDPQQARKLMSSDWVCSRAGLDELRRRLHLTLSSHNHSFPSASGSRGQCRVVIVGGSHSAFSAAWVCLNKLQPQSDTDNENKSPGKLVGEGVVGDGEGEGASQSPKTADAVAAEKGSHSSPISIVILHRSPIRVFYSNRREAVSEGGKHVLISSVNDYGQVNAFCGLRGDAKRLYLDIVSGREQRVKLVQTKSVLLTRSSASDPDTHCLSNLASKLCEEAVALVWACGYSSNLVPILDAGGRAVPVKMKSRSDGGQVEVDHQARLLQATIPTAAGSPEAPSLPIKGLFGTGLGFGLRPLTFINRMSLQARSRAASTLGSAAREESADGVAVYVKRAATVVLAGCLGPHVFGAGGGSWEDRVVANLHQKQILLTNLKKPKSPSRVRPDARSLTSCNAVVEVENKPSWVSQQALARRLSAHKGNDVTNTKAGSEARIGNRPWPRSSSSSPTKSRVGSRSIARVSEVAKDDASPQSFVAQTKPPHIDEFDSRPLDRCVIYEGATALEAPATAESSGDLVAISESQKETAQRDGGLSIQTDSSSVLEEEKSPLSLKSRVSLAMVLRFPPISTLELDESHPRTLNSTGLEQRVRGTNRNRSQRDNSRQARRSVTGRLIQLSMTT